MTRTEPLVAAQVLDALRVVGSECRDANASAQRAVLALCDVPPEIGADLAERLADAANALQWVADVCERVQP